MTDTTTGQRQADPLPPLSQTQVDHITSLVTRLEVALGKQGRFADRLPSTVAVVVREELRDILGDYLEGFDERICRVVAAALSKCSGERLQRELERALEQYEEKSHRR